MAKDYLDIAESLLDEELERLKRECSFEALLAGIGTLLGVIALAALDTAQSLRKISISVGKGSLPVGQTGDLTEEEIGEMAEAIERCKK